MTFSKPPRYRHSRKITITPTPPLDNVKCVVNTVLRMASLVYFRFFMTSISVDIYQRPASLNIIMTALYRPAAQRDFAPYRKFSSAHAEAARAISTRCRAF